MSLLPVRRPARRVPGEKEPSADHAHACPRRTVVPILWPTRMRWIAINAPRQDRVLAISRFRACEALARTPKGRIAA